MEQAVQFMMGTSLTILGLSFFLCTKDWMSWFRDVEHAGKEVALPLGALNLMLGSLILGFHQIWEGWPLLVSVIGVLMMAKGTFYLLFPGWLPGRLKTLTQSVMRPYLMFYGVAILVIGIGTLNYWYTAQATLETTFFDMVFGGPAQ